MLFFKAQKAQKSQTCHGIKKTATSS
jgi:hypothetical protein